jgi:hypothetical protein
MVSASLAIVVLLNGWKLFFSFTIGLLAFATVNLGILTAGTYGLNNNTLEVIEGLNRLILALLIIWKISAEMRHLKLDINPQRVERSLIKRSLYGIIYPIPEFFRLLKILIYVVAGFYFVVSGLKIISFESVNFQFFLQTERLGTNLIFLGIQTPMMMASRASVSRTFSDYIRNMQWAETSLLVGATVQVSRAYRDLLSATEISYDSVNSNGKHLWLTVLLILVLQAFQEPIAAFNLVAILNLEAVAQFFASALPSP